MDQAAAAASSDLSNPLPEVAGALLVDVQRAFRMTFEVNIEGCFFM